MGVVKDWLLGEGLEKGEEGVGHALLFCFKAFWSQIPWLGIQADILMPLQARGFSFGVLALLRGFGRICRFC